LVKNTFTTLVGRLYEKVYLEMENNTKMDPKATQGKVKGKVVPVLN
jgi:hypothetical protein